MPRGVSLAHRSSCAMHEQKASDVQALWRAGRCDADAHYAFETNGVVERFNQTLRSTRSGRTRHCGNGARSPCTAHIHTYSGP